MTDSKALIERLRADWPEILVEKHWMMDSDAIEEQRREAADHIEKLEADNARLRGLLREAEVKLTDVQGAYATKRYADNLLARIRAALQETSHD